MKMSRRGNIGKFIVIEGIDGSGKGSQAELLRDRLKKEGHAVDKITFPNYKGNFFGKEIGDYLNGSFGADVHPKLASLLYALDRYESLSSIKGILNNGESLISDRYVSSNIAHQSIKLPPEERDSFIKWLHKVEFEILGLPKPDLTIFLDLTPDIAYELIAKKAKRDYTDKVRDIHEADPNHLRLAYEAYSKQASLNPIGWTKVKCVDTDGLRSIEDISDDILRVVKKILK